MIEKILKWFEIYYDFQHQIKFIWLTRFIFVNWEYDGRKDVLLRTFDISFTGGWD